jgi:hypothetical protein
VNFFITIILTWFFQEESIKYTHNSITAGANEQYLQMYKCDVKGRGIRSLKTFKKGEFVIEYKG